MRAVLMTAVGGPDVLKVAELVDERYLARKPERLAFVQAAAAPLVTITAWEALRERARVSAGQTVLVQAGAGGVGHMSVQIARLAGARVATTVSPGAKTELATSLGAELCIDYTHEDVGRSCVPGLGPTAPTWSTIPSAASASGRSWSRL